MRGSICWENLPPGQGWLMCFLTTFKIGFQETFLEFAKQTARQPRQQAPGSRRQGGGIPAPAPGPGAARERPRAGAGRRRLVPRPAPGGEAGPKYRAVAARGGSKPTGREPGRVRRPAAPPGAEQQRALPGCNARRMLRIPPPRREFGQPKTIIYSEQRVWGELGSQAGVRASQHLCREVLAADTRLAQPL